MTVTHPPAPALLLLDVLELGDQLEERDRALPHAFAVKPALDLVLQPLDGTEPAAEIDLLAGTAPKFLAEQVLPVTLVFRCFHDLQLLGLHPQEG